MPGFLHQKFAPFLSRLISAQGHQYTAEEILKAYPPHKDATSGAFYTKSLSRVDRYLLKKGVYSAVAVEWTLRRKHQAVIRYSVKTPDGTVLLDQYIKFPITRGGWIKVEFDTFFYGDLVTLEGSRSVQTNKLQTDVFERYFGRKLKVYVGTVAGRNDMNNAGKKLPRPPHLQYSVVRYLMDAK